MTSTDYAALISACVSFPLGICVGIAGCAFVRDRKDARSIKNKELALKARIADGINDFRHRAAVSAPDFTETKPSPWPCGFTLGLEWDRRTTVLHLLQTAQRPVKAKEIGEAIGVRTNLVPLLESLGAKRDTGGLWSAPGVEA